MFAFSALNPWRSARKKISISAKRFHGNESQFALFYWLTLKCFIFYFTTVKFRLTCLDKENGKSHRNELNMFKVDNKTKQFYFHFSYRKLEGLTEDLFYANTKP